MVIGSYQAPHCFFCQKHPTGLISLKEWDVCLWQGGHVVGSPAMNPYGTDPEASDPRLLAEFII